MHLYMCENGAEIYRRLEAIFLGENNIDFRESLALEYIENQISYYERFCGYTVLDSELTGLTQLTTADQPEHAWLLEYRLQLKDPEYIVLTDGMEMAEDGWLTERSSYGQPIPLIYDNGEQPRSYGASWTGLVETSCGGNYDQYAKQALTDFLYEMSDSAPVYDGNTNMLTIPTVSSPSTHAWPEELLPQNWYFLVEVLVNGCRSVSECKPGTTFDLMLDLNTAAEAWLIPVRVDADGARIQGSPRDLLPLTLTRGIDEVAYSLAFFPSHLASNDPQSVADGWLEAWIQQCCSVTPGNPFQLTSHQVLDCHITAVPSDGSTDRMGIFFQVAVQGNWDPPESSPWFVADARLGTGKLEGWLIFSRFATLKLDRGSWTCTELGTGMTAYGTQWMQVESKLQQQQLDKLSRWLSGRDNYGFLLSNYEDVRDVNLHEVFYNGADLPSYAAEPYVQAAFPSMLDVTCINAQDMDTFLLKRTGCVLEEMRKPLTWEYLEEYGLYCHAHVDTNYNTFSCYEGYETANGDYVLDYSLDFSTYYRTEDGVSIPTLGGTVVLRPIADGYQFISNQLHLEEASST